MATMYAWSNFPVEVNEWGQPTKTIKTGEKISQNDLKVSDEEWEELIESGAVREEEYPDIPDDVAPAEYQKQVANATIELQEAQQILDGVREDREEDKPKATQLPAPGTTSNKKE